MSQFAVTLLAALGMLSTVLTAAVLEFYFGRVPTGSNAMGLFIPLMTAVLSGLAFLAASSVLAARGVLDPLGWSRAAALGAAVLAGLLIGAAILVMVACVALYGHLVGRFMTRKYHELEAAHDAAVASEARAVGYAGDLSQANGRMMQLNGGL